MRADGGTLYTSLLVFDASGGLALHHRKLMPTYKERTVWGQGDGSSLATIGLNGARVGGLICWENLMPLARHALYAQGEQIHLAPTADTGAAWQACLRHIAVMPGMLAARMSAVSRATRDEHIRPQARVCRAHTQRSEARRAYR